MRVTIIALQVCGLLFQSEVSDFWLEQEPINLSWYNFILHGLGFPPYTISY